MPQGGMVNAETGDVLVRGTVVDHFASCAVSSQMQFPNAYGSGSQLPASAQWYVWSDAQWASIGGAKYPFNEFDSVLYVPTNPNPPNGDTAIEYFFSSLQNNQGLSNNGTGTGSGIVLLQGVLQWGATAYYGGKWWTIASWVVYNCNSSGGCSFGYSPDEKVNAHDRIETNIYQTASNPDTWQIDMTDITSGAWSSGSVSIPNSWPKFGSAQNGVFEAYNVNSMCTDLSPDNSITFYEAGLSEAYPTWRQYYRVDSLGANLVSWNLWNLNLSPNCSWSGAALPTYTNLTWME